MRPLRRLLAGSFLAPFLLLPLLSCGNPKPSPKAVAEALGQATTFVEPRTVIVARRIEATTPSSFGGGAMDDRQLATIDPVVAILHAAKAIDIQDMYGPDGNGGYNHILTIRPGTDYSSDLFVETDDPMPDPPLWVKTRKTPGWRVTLGRRELVKVWQVIDPSSPMAERLSPGYVLARLDFRWIPTDIGKAFDQGSAGFDDMSRDLQASIINFADMNSQATCTGQVWLTRDKNGKWYVTLFDSRRCSTQS